MADLTEGVYRLTVERFEPKEETAEPQRRPARRAKSPFRSLSFLGFVLFVALLVIAAILARHYWKSAGLFAFLVAVLGGLLQEIVQSGGLITAPRPLKDGMYLGSLSGAALGALVGVTAVATGVPSPDTYSLAPALGSFSLKGGFEALVAQHNVRRELGQTL